MKMLTGLISRIFASAGQGGGHSLRLRVQAGSVMTLGGFGIAQALRLVSNLILTRLLVPEAFGLMAVAVSINIWAVMLTDIGVASSVIRSKNSEDPDFIRTAWTVQLLRNLVVWGIILASALGIHVLAAGRVFDAASIYADPLLPWVMAAAGVQLLIGGLSSINRAMAQRRLAMSRVIALEIGAQLFAMLVTIGFAFAGFGVWALIIGMLSNTAVSSIASHVIFPGPPMRFRLKRDYFWEIFNFGKWLIIASFFGFIVNRGDQILFGGFMNSDRFSLYAIATIWVTAASTVTQTITQRILFPAFSELVRERPQNLTQAYKKTRLVIEAVSIFMAYGAFFLAEPVFSILYTDEYADVGYYVKLLSPFLLLTPFKLISTIVLAGGDSRNFTGVTVLAGIVVLTLTPLMFSLFGEKSAIVVFALAEAAALPIIWRIGSKWIRIDPLVEARMLGAIALLAVLIFTIG